MTNSAIRPLCVALAATLLLGTAAAAEETPGYDRAVHQAALAAGAASSRDQAAIIGEVLAARALARLPAVQAVRPPLELRVAAAVRGRVDRS